MDTEAHSPDLPTSSDDATPKIPRPERPCKVCGAKTQGVYFGAEVCLPCKSFFIRHSQDGASKFLEHCSRNCVINVSSRASCKSCRFQKCKRVGMVRKERPEILEVRDDEQLCQVCGDLANGTHFGVLTCEGCKKFFRRGLRESKAYYCKKNRNCPVNPKTRNSCRYCRYKKCLNMGMSKEAIKMGRPKKMSFFNENHHPWVECQHPGTLAWRGKDKPSELSYETRFDDSPPDNGTAHTEAQSVPNHSSMNHIDMDTDPTHTRNAPATELGDYSDAAMLPMTSSSVTMATPSSVRFPVMSPEHNSEGPLHDDLPVPSPRNSFPLAPSPEWQQASPDDQSSWEEGCNHCVCSCPASDCPLENRPGSDASCHTGNCSDHPVESNVDTVQTPVDLTTKASAFSRNNGALDSEHKVLDLSVEQDCQMSETAQKHELLDRNPSKYSGMGLPRKRSLPDEVSQHTYTTECMGKGGGVVLNESIVICNKSASSYGNHEKNGHTDAVFCFSSGSSARVSTKLPQTTQHSPQNGFTSPSRQQGHWKKTQLRHILQQEENMETETAESLSAPEKIKFHSNGYYNHHVSLPQQRELHPNQSITFPPRTNPNTSYQNESQPTTPISTAHSPASLAVPSAHAMTPLPSLPLSSNVSSGMSTATTSYLASYKRPRANGSSTLIPYKPAVTKVCDPEEGFQERSRDQLSFNAGASDAYWENLQPPENYTPAADDVRCMQGLLKAFEDYANDTIVHNSSTTGLEDRLNRLPLTSHLDRPSLPNPRPSLLTQRWIQFMSVVPGFDFLPLNDIYQLANHGCVDGAILVGSIHQDSRGKPCLEDVLAPLRCLKEGFVFQEALSSFMRDFQLLNHSPTEIAFLLALLTLSTDLPGLGAAHVIEYHRNRVLAVFRIALQGKWSCPQRRMRDLFSFIPRLRRLGVWHDTLLKKTRKPMSLMDNEAPPLRFDSNMTCVKSIS